MMPPYSYYNYSRGGNGGDGGHPYIQNVEVRSGCSGMDYSYCSGMDSSCTSSLLFVEPCEGLAKMVLRTVDSFATSVVRVMDYGEELCDPVSSGGGAQSVGTGRGSTMSNEYVELLAKIERLQKMVSEKEAVFVATEQGAASEGDETTKVANDLAESRVTEQEETLNESGLVDGAQLMRRLSSPVRDTSPLDKCIESDITQRVGSPILFNKDPAQIKVTSSRDWSVIDETIEAEADLNCLRELGINAAVEYVAPSEDEFKTESGGDGGVKELTNLFSTNQQIKCKSNENQKKTGDLCKSIETEFKGSKQFNRSNRSSNRLKKIFSPLRNKEDKVTVLKQNPAVDSNQFPYASLSAESKVFSWEADFSSNNPFVSTGEKGCVSRDVLSPVTVTASLETRKCAGCGLDSTGSLALKRMNLMVCSTCQVTYYCSSECQSKDWINGHSQTCQPVAVTEILL